MNPPSLLRDDDRAASGVLSTILLIGLTVSLVAVAAVRLPEAAHAATPTRLDLAAGATSGDPTLHLVHQGGQSIDLGALRILVGIGGATFYQGTLGANGTLWGSGQTLDVTLPAALPAGSSAEVQIVDARTRDTVASAHLDVPAASAAAAPMVGFQLQASLNGSAMPLQLTPSSPFRVDVSVAHPEGRKFLRYVYADLSGIGGPSWVDLHDDGTAGDLVSSDGVYGGLLQVPPTAWPNGGSISAHALDLSGNEVAATLALSVIAPPAPPAPPAPLAPLALLPALAPPIVSGTCPADTSAIASYSFLVNGVTTLSDLRGHVHQGDHVRAQFALTAGCTNVQVSLVSYKAPGPAFSQATASLQTVHLSATGTFGAGTNVLDVDVPSCYYQVDFVAGSIITTLGPANTNNFYTPQGRLISADNGGAIACV